MLPRIVDTLLDDDVRPRFSAPDSARECALTRRTAGGARVATPTATLGSTALTYDVAGNLTSDGTNTYTWNARNQLTAISGGTTASFAYDPLGRRSTRTVGGTTTKYLYDGLNAVQEMDGSLSTIANLITGLGLDETFVRTDGAGTFSLLADALGSIVALTNGSGVITTQYTYGPFGQVTVTGAASTNASQFTGRENDGTGLYYYRARYYSTALQRFLSEDPLGLAGGPDAYAYVLDNPTNLVDPLGLQARNFSPRPVLIKTEDEFPGFKWLDPLQDGKPGIYPDPIDGVLQPDGTWLKVPDGTDVTVHSDGSISKHRSPFTIPDFPDCGPACDGLPGPKGSGFSDRHPDWKYPPDDPRRDPDGSKRPRGARK